MKKHNQCHNDLKPQNFLVKFLNTGNDLNQIEIVVTDFGLAGSETRGGTPIFASPECLTNPDRKNKLKRIADIFSLGRVFLFLILSKEQFIRNLFIPITQSGKNEIENEIRNDPILNLISNMMSIKSVVRHKIQDGLRIKLNAISCFKGLASIPKISEIVQKSMTRESKQYVKSLKRNLS